MADSLTSNKTAIVFGENKLVIKCMEYLQEIGWYIASVVTHDLEVITWCKSKNITDISSLYDLQIIDSDTYVFSIINPLPISATILEQIKPDHAINYHDSLLPKYAGVNSTTWSILNDEQYHGITWHEIVSGIDEGNIYYQAKILIEQTDTVFDVNLKCLQAALSGFVKIIDRIERNILTGTKQDLKLRTYFGREHIPFNYAYLDDLINLPYINKLFRSLSFGESYVNPVATVKVSVKSESYIIEAIDPRVILTKPLTSSEDGLVFRDIYGIKIKDFSIDKLNGLILLDTECKEFQRLKRHELYYYHKLINDGFPKFGDDKVKTRVDEYGIKELNMNLSLIELVSFLITASLRIGSEGYFVKIYYPYVDASESELLKNTIDVIKLVRFEKSDLFITYDDLKSKVSESLIPPAMRLIKDFGYRYNLDLCSDIAILYNYQGKVDSHKIIFCLDDKSRSLSVKYSPENTQNVEVLIKILEVLSSVKNQEKAKILEIKLLNDKEYQKVIYEWNKTEKAYPKDKTIHQLFEEQAERAPNNVAVVFEDQKLTYRELNEKANQLARYIRTEYQKITKEELKPDTLIALFLDRSLEMIVGIVATLKAGGAYVPLDPNYPQDRINYILEDTQAKLILTQKKMLTLSGVDKYTIDNSDVQKDLKSLGISKIKKLQNDKVILIDLTNKDIYQPGNNKEARESKLNLVSEVSGDNKLKYSNYSSSTNLAYVVYTSGTTGKPKGVMIEHGNVINLLVSLHNLYSSITGDDKSTLFTSYVFDVFASELFGSITNGLELHILDNIKRNDFSLLSDYLVKARIAIAYIPPIILSNMEKKNYPVLRTIIYAGEPCDRVASSFWSQQVCLYNCYGPTESSVYAICKHIILDEVEQIGKPLSNIKTYILDQNQQPLPVGGIGELYLGGAGLSRGYLNREDLTKERFIANPFATKEDIKSGYTRLYKTGDLCRYLEDGDIEYIGRNDDQVKIRGYRIELGEIESVLSAIEGIRHSCVLAKVREGSRKKQGPGNVEGSETFEAAADTTKYLVGYYVLDGRAKLSETDVLTKLSEKLPEYMVPAYVVEMEEFPLTINGKLDKKVLPEPRHKITDSYVAPRTKLEEELVKIYAAVLGVSANAIGVNDDFFELGGNSILAVKLTYKINSHFNSHLRVVDLFLCKSPALISNRVVQFKHVYQPCIKLNSTYNKANLFMIHTADAGCESYSFLANRLKNIYSCYGIDNYNLHHENKLDDLKKLANYYLNSMTDIMQKTKQVRYFILGWSLGGVIAAQVALLLEEHGIKDITLIILDSIFMSANEEVPGHDDIERSYEKDKARWVYQYEKSYVEKLLKNYRTDRILSYSVINGKLKYTKIYLLKSTENMDGTLRRDNLYVNDNNITSITDPMNNNLAVINIANAHHENIIKNEDTIIQIINDL